MARIRAFFEKDIKKIVALSTLSQLGVIIRALGAGFRVLGFFHLLSHAFFKALLFIRAGRLIHNSNRYQDLRKMGGSADVLPFTKRIIIGCLISLCGLPFISAFISIRYRPRHFILGFKSDRDILTNIRIGLLFLPAVSGGSFVRMYIKFSFFLIISFKIKIFVLILLIPSVVVLRKFYFYIVELTNLLQ